MHILEAHQHQWVTWVTTFVIWLFFDEHACHNLESLRQHMCPLRIEQYTFARYSLSSLHDKALLLVKHFKNEFRFNLFWISDGNMSSLPARL